MNITDAAKQLRDWQAQIIHGPNVFGEIADAIDEAARDCARIDWMNTMAEECEGHVLSRCFFPDGRALREKIDEAMRLNPTIG